ncbi:MAG: hypothetical protein HY271_08435 [Deltaproteobacteria bacterium]|nr:hypothetical protein [Deltaproteobacteria bacterium]
MIRVAARWCRGAIAIGALLVWTPGCGGSGGGGGGSGGGPPATPPPSGDALSVFVVTTDFDTGRYSVFPVGDPAAISRSLGEVHSDAVARTQGGLVYVVNRLGGDNIQAIDPAAGWSTRWQCSVGNGTNPHDIVVVAPNKAYVTLYEKTTLAIVDPSVGPSCNGFLRGTIDLGALADADGIPEMDQEAVVGNRLYVSLERLNRRNFFQPTDASVLAVIDTTSDTLVDADPTTSAVDGIRLAGTNPFAESHHLTVEPATGAILVGSVGSFGVIGDGGVERVNTHTNRSEGFLVTESDLGANITDFVLVDAHRAYALLLDLASINRLVRFDPTTRVLTDTLLTSSEFLVDIEREPTRGELYVTDRTLTRPGIRIFSTSDDHEITTAPIDTGLPPFDLVFVNEAAPSVPAPSAMPTPLPTLLPTPTVPPVSTTPIIGPTPQPGQSGCGNGIVESGEECDGSAGGCAPDEQCSISCTCVATAQQCTTATVTIDLDTPQPIAAATLILDYPVDAVNIPGSGDASTVTARISMLTSAQLFGNGAPNDEDNRVRFTLIAVDGIDTGPLLSVRFDCLGAPPAVRDFTCTLDDAVALDGVTSVRSATCTLHVRSE